MTIHNLKLEVRKTYAGKNNGRTENARYVCVGLGGVVCSTRLLTTAAIGTELLNEIFPSRQGCEASNAKTNLNETNMVI